MRPAATQTVRRIERRRYQRLRHAHAEVDARQVHHCGHGEAVGVWVEVRSERHNDAALDHLASRRRLQTQNVRGGGQKDGDSPASGESLDPRRADLFEVARGGCLNYA